MSGNTHINLIYSDVSVSDSYETSHSFYAPQFLCPWYFSFLLFFLGGGILWPTEKERLISLARRKSSNLELKSESGGLVYDKLISLFIWQEMCQRLPTDLCVRPGFMLFMLGCMGTFPCGSFCLFFWWRSRRRRPSSSHHDDSRAARENRHTHICKCVSLPSVHTHTHTHTTHTHTHTYIHTYTFACMNMGLLWWMFKALCANDRAENN